MFKKRVIVLIIHGDNGYRLITDNIWFWKSKIEFSNNVLLKYIDKIEKKGIIDIKIY